MNSRFGGVWGAVGCMHVVHVHASQMCTCWTCVRQSDVYMTPIRCVHFLVHVCVWSVYITIVAVHGVLGVLRLGVGVGMGVGVEMGEKSFRAGGGAGGLPAGGRQAAAAAALSGEPGEGRRVAEQVPGSPGRKWLRRSLAESLRTFLPARASPGPAPSSPLGPAPFPPEPAP